MSNIKVAINIVIFNGEKYIRHCLDSILAQTYPRELIEVNILDNGSTDKTIAIIKSFDFTKLTFVESKVNLGMWPGQEELIKYSSGKYILAMAVDIILDPHFIERAVEGMERDSSIGAIEPKIYKFDIETLGHSPYPSNTDIIDTCGFEIYKSRRIVNVGHGQQDSEQFQHEKEIFAVEGAAPFFRKSALEDLNVDGKIIDPTYFWYGDDLDLAWRLNMAGWKQILAPNVICWHDRQTTKKLKSSYWDFISLRREIPIKKRRLDWRNVRFTIIKNDYIINILKDLPYILVRELMLLGYIVLFEPAVLLEIPVLVLALPKLLHKRRIIMAKAKRTPAEIHRWFL